MSAYVFHPWRRLWCSTYTELAVVSRKLSCVLPVYLRVRGAVTVCDDLSDQKTCDFSIINGTNCHWCASTLVPSSCYSEAQARILPSTFSCDWNNCGAIADRTVCDYAHDATGAACHWCRKVSSWEEDGERREGAGKELAAFEVLAGKRKRSEGVLHCCAQLSCAGKSASCVNDSAAHALPPAVFKCDNVTVGSDTSGL